MNEIIERLKQGSVWTSFGFLALSTYVLIMTGLIETNKYVMYILLFFIFTGMVGTITFLYKKIALGRVKW